MRDKDFSFGFTENILYAKSTYLEDYGSDIFPTCPIKVHLL